MKASLLFILVEGADDERFFRRIVIDKLSHWYGNVQIVKYADKTPKWVNNFINSIQKMGATYIFVADLDQCPCVTDRKTKEHNRYRNCELQYIQVVEQEIESWYLAGLTSKAGEQFKLSVKDTNFLTKEQFNQLLPPKFGHRDFLVEVLKYFSWEIAITRNRSFKYFAEKYQLMVEK